MDFKTIDIYEKLKPFLTEKARLFIFKRIETAVLQYIYEIQDKELIRMLVLCKWIGKVVNYNVDEIPEEEYMQFAGFINEAIDKNILKYGILNYPAASQLADGRTLIKIYAFSDFKNPELNTIFEYGLGFKDIKAYLEGGLPDSNVLGCTEDKMENIYHNIYQKGKEVKK